MTDNPIIVKFNSLYYAMIGVSETNAVLVDQTGTITLAALTAVTVTDVNITSKVRYLRKA